MALHSVFSRLLPRLPLVALIVVGGLSVTCGGIVRAEVEDVCLDDDDTCPVCESDDECVFMGNPCTDYVACAHTDAELAFVDIGCSEALERRWPEPEECGCVQQVCQSVEP